MNAHPDTVATAAHAIHRERLAAADYTRLIEQARSLQAAQRPRRLRYMLERLSASVTHRTAAPERSTTVDPLGA
jgi:hypothetical protein